MSYPKQPPATSETSEQDSFVQLVNRKNVIILPNDPPSKESEDEYIVIRDTPTAKVDWDALFEGLDTLRICSRIFSAAATDELPKVLRYVNRKLSPRQQLTLFLVLSAIFETTNWMRFERLVVQKEEFEISAVVWAFKLGPKGLMLGRLKGKKDLEMLLEAEEAWIAANDDTAGYEEGKKALLQLAAGIVEWGSYHRGRAL
ncbi:hypothetical protein ACET3X_002011 [Alternaria dauci]|uniref:Uncharacterized protein n=1 Tax=Alternaria dauci TaxID=48095 RepID=A0ABR3UZ98_9PLEO